MANYELTAVYGVTPSPVLGTPALGTPSSVSITVSVPANKAGGTIFFASRLSTDGVLSKDNIENGTGNTVSRGSDASVFADGTNSALIAGLTASTGYTVDMFWRDSGGTETAVKSTSGFTTAAASGVAVLSSATNLSSTGSLTYSSGVTTDTSGGMLHWMHTEDASPRSAAVIMRHNAKRVTSSGAQTVDGIAPAGAAGVAYYIQFVQVINDVPSNVIVTSGTGTVVVTGTPTMAQVRSIAEDKRLTQPDWMTEGVAGLDATDQSNLPTGATYQSGTNSVVVSSGATVDIIGFDFAATETVLSINAGGTVGTLAHCKFGFDTLTAADRYLRLTNSVIAPDPCIWLRTTSSASSRIDHMHNCVIDGGGNGFKAGTNTQGYFRSELVSKIYHSSFGVMEFCRITGFDNDGFKAPCAGTRRAIFFDTSTNGSFDLTAWDSGATYNQGDWVYDPSTKYLRWCKNNGVTSAPDFSARTAGTTDWGGVDPHSDAETVNGSPTGTLARWEWCLYHRQGANRMMPSTAPGMGYNACLYIKPNNSGTNANANIGQTEVEYCIFTMDTEDRFTNHPVQIYSGAATIESASVTNCWHEDASKFIGTSESVTTSGNSATFAWGSAATLSNVSASYAASVLSYEFDSDKNGWATIVVSTSNSMTDDEVRAATVGGSIELVQEGHCRAGESWSVNDIDASGLTSGTRYVHMLFQAGGHVDTRAATQTITV